jgi:hypothetical protein
MFYPREIRRKRPAPPGTATATQRYYPVDLPIVSGDMRAGNVFHLPVRTLAGETNSYVSEPPGNSRGFQARAVLLPSRSKAARRIFNACYLKNTGFPDLPDS